MQITVLCEYGTVQGGERSLLAVIDELKGDGFRFTVVAPGEGRIRGELSRRGIPHHPVALHDAGGRRLPRDAIVDSLTRAVGASRPQLLHANSLSMGRLSGLLGERLGIPATSHLRDIIRLSRRAAADLRRNRTLIAVSEATRTFHSAQGIDPQRTAVIHNGVNCREFRPRPASGRLRKQLGVPENALLAATVGQICLRKGHDVLASAAEQFLDVEPAVHFLIVGERHSTKPESRALDESIDRRFRAAGMADRLHRLGYRDDVAAILNEVDLLVHPARQEPLGRVLLEAAASGTPIVATRVGGTSEILEHEVSALLVCPDDGDALAGGIRRLAREKHLRRRLATAARQEVVRRFDVRRCASATAELWARVAGGGR